MSYAAVQHLQLLVEETTAHVGSTLRQTGGGMGKRGRGKNRRKEDRVIEEDNKNDGRDGKKTSLVPRPLFLVLWFAFIN